MDKIFGFQKLIKRRNHGKHQTDIGTDAGTQDAFARRMKKLLVCFLVVTGCAANDNMDSAEKSIESTDSLTVEVAPDLAKAYIQYNGHFAYEQVILHADQSYHVIVGSQIMTGTWSFDLPTSTLTMVPGKDSVAPDVLVYPVKKATCHPDGWYPVLMRNGHKMIPYGIDPDFDAKYCELFHP